MMHSTRRAGDNFIIIAQNRLFATRWARFERDSPSAKVQSTSFEYSS